jgi:hypothetical protein
MASAYNLCATISRLFATGEGWFHSDNAGITSALDVHLSRQFHPKGRLAAALLSVFVRMQWKGYMRGCIVNTNRLASDAAS